jgi:hypothetical protein
MLKRVAALAFAALATPLPVLAGPGTEIVRQALYAGDIDSGSAALRPLADAGEQEAKFGLGMLTFVSAVEGLAQALYRHGLAAPDSGPMGPVLVMPVPKNPNPEPLDYDKLRAILASFVDTLDAAAVVLQEAGKSGDYVVQIDPTRIRIDINDDGVAEEGETIANILGSALGEPTLSTVPLDAPDTGGLRNDKSLGTKDALPRDAAPPEHPIAFDRADAIWLAGYSNVIAAQADFLLAHDFSSTVAVAFHRLFPQAGFPMQEYSTGGQLMLDPQTDNAIADLIATIHTINWPVVEPDRLKRVLTRFQTVTKLSRENWAAIMAETDSDPNELVPNPRQTTWVPEMVTDEKVAAWLATLDTADKILAGELLVPHWRFKQGFDLKAYFETATRTDLVMLLTGYGALPFLKDGPVATAESFAEANRVFGDDFLGYAFWFN